MGNNTLASSKRPSPFKEEWAKCQREQFNYHLQNGSDTDIATHYLVLQENNILSAIEGINIDKPSILDNIEDYKYRVGVRSGQIKERKRRSTKKKVKSKPSKKMISMFKDS